MMSLLIICNNFYFNTDVRDLSQQCVGGQELQRMRKQIHALSEKTSGSLKKNVYQNYMQFIDTAKEISRILFRNCMSYFKIFAMKIS